MSQEEVFKSEYSSFIAHKKGGVSHQKDGGGRTDMEKDGKKCESSLEAWFPAPNRFLFCAEGPEPLDIFCTLKMLEHGKKGRHVSLKITGCNVSTLKFLKIIPKICIVSVGWEGPEGW